ncbi:hypothetical protein KBC89_02645 [Candidatus Woesebacteria bacterium]|nr:hypothetical protein [Candidatus Woesebacteria bacterium]
MQKTISIFVGLAVLAVVGVFIVSRMTDSQTPFSPDASQKILGEEIQKDTDVAVPTSLSMDCSQFNKQSGQEYQVSCDTFPKEAVCSYYIVSREGQQSIQNLQYTNACAACRFYGETGAKTIGTTQYEHLGYKAGVCE